MKPERLAINSNTDNGALATRFSDQRFDALRSQVHREWELLAVVAPGDKDDLDPALFEFIYVHASALAIFAEDVLEILKLHEATTAKTS